MNWKESGMNPNKSSRNRGHEEPVVSERKSVDKKRGAKVFRGQSEKTHALNLAQGPMRGGIRL